MLSAAGGRGSPGPLHLRSWRAKMQIATRADRSAGSDGGYAGAFRVQKKKKNKGDCRVWSASMIFGRWVGSTAHVPWIITSRAAEGGDGGGEGSQGPRSRACASKGWYAGRDDDRHDADEGTRSSSSAWTTIRTTTARRRRRDDGGGGGASPS